MSSITLNITYNSLSKKVTCSRTTSINQVITQSLEKFKLDPSAYTGELFNSSNGKKVDPHLPIRLTNLLNNSKLKLEVKQVDSAASVSSILNLKVVVFALNNELKSYVIKIAGSSTVQKFLEALEDLHSISLFGLEHYLQVTILDVTLDNKEQGKFEQTTLNSVIGSGVSSLAIRVRFKGLSENTERLSEQNRINELQLKQQAMRNQKRQEQEKLEREVKQKEEEKTHVDEIDKEEEEKEREMGHGVAEKNALASVGKEELVEYSGENKQKNETSAFNDVSESSYVSAPFVPTPQLFLPSQKNAGKHSIYENPEEDYNMTVSQIQKYHTLITKSARPTKREVSKTAVPINVFAIRLKFPDRSILQFTVDDGTNAKIGTLLKKIDSFVNPVYINNYHLKLGYPPFSRIEFGFSHNNELLRNHPAFSSSKTVLIWELSELKAIPNEPFVKNVEEIKDSSDLPEMVLEMHRGELAEEKEASAPRQTRKTDEKPNDAKKIPKWFKMK